MKKYILKYKRNRTLPKGALILTVILMLFIRMGYAQESFLWSKKAQAVLKPSGKTGWLEFKDETNINPQSLFTEYNYLFGLGTDDEMRLIQTENDNIGMVHFRYQQYYKGVPVKNADYIIHSSGDRVVSANGKIINGISREVSPVISEENALQEALKYVKSTKYMWLNAAEENRLKQKQKNNDATYYPHGELIFVRPSDDRSAASGLVLCRKFDINVEDGLSKTVFINVQDGSLTATLPLDINCIQTTGTTAYNGSKTIFTSTGSGNYVLLNDCGATQVHVRSANNQTDLSSVTEYIDVNNVWTNQPGVQSFYCLRQTYFFYLNTYSRNSFDNAGSNIDGYNNAWFLDEDGNPYPNNAQWSSGGHYIRFGPGNTSSSMDDLNTDDIVGHEFTHGVTQYEAGLDYQDESGALNESFSDIFGEMVERYIEGSNDWLMGADRSTGYLRNMSNPNDKGQPDTYSGTNWYSGTEDHGGVHTNSGVQNYCFYLLSVGGTGVNDNGDDFSVSGIGADAAGAIAYRALSVYLSSGSQYIDAREAWIHAAIDLYGSCSNEAVQSGRAWDAVGVGLQLSQYDMDACGTYPVGSNVFLQAINTLRGANGCLNSIVTSPFSVTYSASEKVILYPGFNAANGSHFVAYVEPCALTIYRAINPSLNDQDADNKIVADNLSAGNTAEGNSFLIAPSPFTDHLSFSFDLADAGMATINIYDLLGKKVMEEIIYDGIKGANVVTVNTGMLKAGAYFAEYVNGNNKSIQKIVKTK